jgi:predicted ABC-type ATPase
MRVTRMAVAVPMIVNVAVCVFVHGGILPDKWMELLWQNDNAALILMSPALYIIAGPNGAGKTTFAREFLPNYAACRNFINADLIAKGVAPFSPESVAFRAGRLMLEEIDFNVKRGEDFSFETTLSGRSYLRLIRLIKKGGYRVHFFFLSVPTVDLALDRIRDRVLEGGHDIPERIVRRRFERSTQNFLDHYRYLADSWILFDNSGAAPTVVAFDKQGESRIIQKVYYEALTNRRRMP